MNDYENLQAMIERSIELAHADKVDDSEILLKQAYRIYREMPERYASEIRYSLTIKDWKRALNQALEACRLFSSSLPYAWAAASLAMFRLGKFENARRLALVGIRLSGGSPELRYELARGLAYACQFRECVAELIALCEQYEDCLAFAKADPDFRSAIAWADFEGVEIGPRR